MKLFKATDVDIVKYCVKGVAENATAGPENAGPIMSSLRDQNSSNGKCKTENAELENARPRKC